MYRYVPSSNSRTKLLEKDSTSISALCVFNNTLYIGTGQKYGITSKELGCFTIGNLTGIAPSLVAPSAFALKQNYPNPFNPSTQISFTVTQEGTVSLRVYDVLGREIATILHEKRKAGTYVERFDGSQLTSGTYMYVLRTPEGRRVGRMMLLR